MYNSAFYKLSAREQLKNNYLPAVLCAIVCMVPSYFVTKLSLLALNMNISPTLTQLLSVIVQIFAVNILTVGFIRFLMKLTPREERSFAGYDFDLVFSGYTMNFKRTLAATFLRWLKVLLWTLLAALPTIVGMALIIVTVPAEALENLVRMWMLAGNEPSNENILMFARVIEATLPHISRYIWLWLVATVLLIIPLIRKSYSYAMISYIMAEYPDMTAKEAFRRSRDIMIGYRWRFFTLQLSFILFIILISLSFTLTGSLILYCLAQAILLPYQFMTYSRFFKQRNEVIEYNIEKNGDTEKQEIVQ